MGRKSAKQIAADKRKLDNQKNKKKKEVDRLLASVASTIILSGEMCLEMTQLRLQEVERTTGGILSEDIDYHFRLNRRETQKTMDNVLKSLEISKTMDEHIFRK